MRLFKGIVYSIFVFLLTSCNGPEEFDANNNAPDRKFQLQKYDTFTLLLVNDAWQNASHVSFKYVLADSFAFVPDSLHNYTFIKTPVKRVIVFSTTHIGFLLAIEEGESIIAASGRNYIYNNELKAKAGRNEIKEIGFAPGINYESIVELNPDLIFIYGIESSVTGIISRLQSAGIPCVIIGDYLENHPIAKMEWIKVFASFYHKNELADSIYSDVSEKYNKLCQLTETRLTSRPTVMLGLPWKDSWNMAGGRSFTAKLIGDAGGDYLWADTDNDEFLPLGIESVISTALNADYWLNTGSARSLDDIKSRDKRYTAFKAWENHSLYNNDKQFNGESNNFWEKGVVEPHLILRDLIKIFHPEILPEDDFVYYRRLE
ncbi:MAG: ABC transporter substrate-binding protein [Bacteroidales bacterium]|nr:ABC transporter substrate-binding protein [Bacteroidales bacterium]MCF8389518.1 ABC transporter substrate-binding protein [Bacteroidales bacterium]